MRIGEFSKKTGISVDTLRYYDKIGLLIPVKENQQRQYSEADLIRVQMIAKLKTMNFTLDEMKEILELDEKIDEDFQSGKANLDLAIQVKDMLEFKYVEVLQLESDLQEAKVALQHLLEKMGDYLQMLEMQTSDTD